MDKRNNSWGWAAVAGLLTVVILLAAGCRGWRAVLNPPQSGTGSARAVPGEYQSLYTGIAGKVDGFLRQVEPCAGASTFKPVFAAELLPANGHAATQFAIPAYYEGTIAYIDALRSLGVRGVKIAAIYPILASDFPNSAGYLSYYKNVVAELRKRDMKVLVAIGCLFPGEFTDLKAPAAGLTYDKYRKTKREIVETVIRELRPDYLTIANEPTTEEMTTGLKVTVADFTATVRYVLEGLDRKGVLVGAGTGSWNNAAYVEALAQYTSIDYFDLHVYPADFLQQALTFADIAKKQGKRLIIGEAWTYKARESELGDLGRIAAQTEMFGRDVFSFWEPLDSRFLSALAALAKCKEYEFISPFWSKYFFSYLDYEAVPKGLSYRQLNQMSNEAAMQAITAGRTSGTGLAYKSLMAGGR